MFRKNRRLAPTQQLLIQSRSGETKTSNFFAPFKVWFSKKLQKCVSHFNILCLSVWMFEGFTAISFRGVWSAGCSWQCREKGLAAFTLVVDVTGHRWHILFSVSLAALCTLMWLKLMTQFYFIFFSQLYVWPKRSMVLTKPFSQRFLELFLNTVFLELKQNKTKKHCMKTLLEGAHFFLSFD